MDVGKECKDGFYNSDDPDVANWNVQNTYGWTKASPSLLWISHSMYRVENRNLQVNVRLSPDSSFPAGPCLEQKNCEKRDRNVIFFFALRCVPLH